MDDDRRREETMSADRTPPPIPTGDLCGETERLKAERDAAFAYIRESVNHLLKVMGTVPLAAEELDDASLIEMDPVGIITRAFEQVLDHLHETNDNMRLANDDLMAVFDSVGAAILVVGTDMRVLAHNRMAAEAMNLGESMVGRRCYELVCGKNAPAPEECSLCRAVETGKRVNGREMGVRSRTYDVVAVPVRNPNGQIDHVVITYVDITERLETLRALAESEQRYRDLFENANDLIQAATADGRLLYVNRTWKRALGYRDAEIAALPLVNVIAPECRRDYIRSMNRLKEGTQSVRLETVFLSKQGARVLVDGDVTVSGEESAGEPLVFRGIFRDVTEQHRLEEEVIKAQRLESVGFLAGGIAHDFNNFLTAILGNISLARLYEDQGLSAQAKLKEAENAAFRAQGLTKQLLTFARGGAPVKREMDLGGLAREAAAFAATGTNVSCAFDIQHDLWPVSADPGQMEQVIHNLIVNAVQAMPRGGTVRVSCANLPESEAVLSQLLPGTPHAVRFIVEDEGVGIPPENLHRVFDPYFSTRPGGTGLGLATVYSIVRDHGGLVTAESEPGKGARFTILLPAVEGCAPAREQRPTRLPGRGERILVMDDDSSILNLLCDLLGHLGYETAAAEDGAEAVHRYGEAIRQGVPFDAVIMDLTVPGGMGGEEALQEIKKIDPTVQAIVSSGYSSDPVMSDPAAYGFAAVVAKPYRVEALAKTVRELLDRK
jgi:PAS domain S-box-containing protein